MEIIILSIFILSVAVYYAYAILNKQEKRVLIKFQVLQVLMTKEEYMSREDLLVELNDLRQPHEMKMKLLDKTVYEMVEAGTLLINQELQVKLHPKVSNADNTHQKISKTDQVNY